MFFISLLLFSALAVSTVAGYFSIMGLTTIFPAVFAEIVAMGLVLEVAKLVTASWLYRNWKIAGKLHKTYLTSAVIVLSFITSLGIYGYLSKAHIEHTITLGGGNDLQIATLERKINTEQRRISDAEKVTAQLDQAVQILQDYDRIRGPEGALAVREGQAEERNYLSQTIESATQTIEELQSQLAPLRQEALNIEADVGPIKYIAALIYDNEEENIDEAVRIIILLIVFVFDPLAILLVIAANQSLLQRRGEQIKFMSEEDLLPETPDYGVEPDELSPGEKEQLKRLDRGLRNKLGWLVDKKRYDGSKSRDI